MIFLNCKKISNDEKILEEITKSSKCILVKLQGIRLGQVSSNHNTLYWPNQRLRRWMRKLKVETEAFRSEVAKVCAELKLWVEKLIEHQGKLEVASTGKQLLYEKGVLDNAGFPTVVAAHFVPVDGQQ
ncbi:structural maintenance of chromosomes protein 4 isoform X2 [Helianthus annuus]|uniref:structural maintenance of chromosomes protein 4 isoform X2 n=1 Tax=Helianthus annuus TaxID=4232 RepID=UPI001652BC42|nr:structural maintenance of chromosomes protein 4 isoform X2 [Helianthus annuus]